MILPELLREIENRGVALSSAGGRLRFQPKKNFTPELIEGLREHKAAILDALDNREVSPVVRDAGEVLVTARARLGEVSPEHLEEAPFPPPEKGRDPLVHLQTSKALFFRGVRTRDLEKRRCDGLPPWIRPVDRGTG